ncbi:MAG: single-stranded DNA-binding protein [Sphaerochaetaceae bacterium]|nr:single-stranded DNA-binding protein [Sphaerochaetaceae bacterium]
MAVDINVVVLVGRLTRDCELKSTPQGTSVCRFSIAVNRRKRTGDRWEDEVSYFDVVLWGRSADTLNPYLQKGRQVSVEGELRQNRWEQDGKTNSKIEVVANNVQLLGGGNQAVPGSTPAPRNDSRMSQPSNMDFNNGPESFDDGDDIPF